MDTASDDSEPFGALTRSRMAATARTQRGDEDEEDEED